MAAIEKGLDGLRSVYRLEPDRGQQTYKPGFTLNFYRELGINRRSSIAYVPPVTAIGVSLGYAAVTVALSLLLGVPAAWVLARRASAQAAGIPRSSESATVAAA